MNLTQRGIDEDNGYSVDDQLKLSIDRLDPYFIWLSENEGRRMGKIRPRKPNPRKSTYLQLIVELCRNGDELTAERCQQFDQLVSNTRAKVRAVYGDRDRFRTLIVPEKYVTKFLSGILSCAERFEVSHPIVTGNDDDESFASRYERGKRAPSFDTSAWNEETDNRLSENVIAVIDYGCPFAHPAFRTEKDSRIKYVWFQDSSALRPGAKVTLPRAQVVGRHTNLFPYGRELRPSTIADRLSHRWDGATKTMNERACYEDIGYDLMEYESSHGGHVLDIAAGWPNPLKPDLDCRDAAANASIIFVQLPRAAVGDSSGAAMSVHLLDALRYIDSRVTPDAKVVVNLSFGTHAGPHDGSSMLESALDDFLSARSSKFRLVVPAGNSYQADSHAQGSATKQNPLELEWEVMPDDPTDSFLEIWHPADKSIQVTVTPPGHAPLAPVGPNSAVTWENSAAPAVPVLTVVNTNSISANPSMTLCVVAPTRNRAGMSQGEAPYGIWKICVKPVADETVTVDAWIERDDAIFDYGSSSRQSRFVVPDQGYEFDVDDEYHKGVVRKEQTLNSYANANFVETVGAVVGPIASNASTVQVASYSSAGPRRVSVNHGDTYYPVPYYVAVSDETHVLLGRNAAGNRERSTVRRNGTSVAAPQVTRALINDPTIGPATNSLGRVEPRKDGAAGNGLKLPGEILQSARTGLGQLVT